MQTRADKRLRKLEMLCNQHGSDAVAVEAGLSPAYVRQILKRTPLPPKKDGTRSPRMLGDDAARAIEKAYGLSVGWFDSDEVEEFPDDAASIARAFNSLKGDARQKMFAVIQNMISVAQAMQAGSSAPNGTPSPSPTPSPVG